MLKVDIVEIRLPSRVERFEVPVSVKLPIEVLSVEKVDRIPKLRDDIFEPATVEKLESPSIVIPTAVLSVEKVDRIPVFKLDIFEPVNEENLKKLF